MRTILIILVKEFKQIFRNKIMLPIIFLMPIIQLLILANAATFDIKNLNISFVDRDNSQISRLLIQKTQSTGFFNVISIEKNDVITEEMLENGDIDIYVNIPSNMEKDLFREGRNEMQLILNAIDAAKAGVAMNYLMNIIQDLNVEINEKYGSKIALKPAEEFHSISVVINNWFNPELNYKTFMVPGILVLLVTMIGEFLTAMNIVKEKEIGTAEQINVTPIKKYQFIMGKMLPFWLIAIFELMFGMGVALLFFDIPFLGNPLVILVFAMAYLVLLLGMGLLISTVTDTQQQAMFISWFFLVIFILLSGLFTAIENMPDWLRYLTYINPIKYFIEVIRMVMLKGSGFADVKLHFLIIAGYAILLNALAVWKYKKVG
jgi:ABC-2 type transport system permease protein